MNANRIRVLLIDDDEDDYLITRDLLSEIKGGKYILSWVANYHAALETIGRNTHDIYLLDYYLGEHNGLTLLQEAIKRGCKRPIILLTGRGDRDVDIASMKAGAADYLLKDELSAALLERSIRYSIERTQTLAALRESEERYALAVRGANDGLWDWNFITGVVYFSPRWKAMVGFDEHEIKNRSDEWFNRVHPDDLEQLKADVANHFNGQTEHLENNHRILHKDQSYRWMLCRGLAFRDGSGTVTRMAGSLTDLTSQRQLLLANLPRELEEERSLAQE